MNQLETAAFRHVADWCAKCLECGQEHHPRPSPRGSRFAETYAHPDGHTYRPRDHASAQSLRAYIGEEQTA